MTIKKYDRVPIQSKDTPCSFFCFVFLAPKQHHDLSRLCNYNQDKSFLRASFHSSPDTDEQQQTSTGLSERGGWVEVKDVKYILYYVMVTIFFLITNNCDPIHMHNELKTSTTGIFGEKKNLMPVFYELYISKLFISQAFLYKNKEEKLLWRKLLQDNLHVIAKRRLTTLDSLIPKYSSVHGIYIKVQTYISRHLLSWCWERLILGSTASVRPHPPHLDLFPTDHMTNIKPFQRVHFDTCIYLLSLKEGRVSSWVS